MGGAVSYAAAAMGGGGDGLKEEADAVDWLNLPCPVKYEEIQRENMISLKPELFEGLRFDFTKPLNQRFSLSHSLFMGSVEVPSQGAQIVKVPAAHYEFGANLIDQRMMMLIGRVLTDGRMSARVKYDITDRLALKVNTQLTNEPHFSQGMLHFDYRGNDFQTQLQLGNNAFYGINYIQSVTPTLALGGEVFWLGHQRKSGVGFAGRYNTDKVVATGQFASTGIVSLTYVQKVSEKVSLASDFLYNWNSKEATTSVGYDYCLRQCRLRGRLDTNGCVAAYLEERLNLGVNFLLSAEAFKLQYEVPDVFVLNKGSLDALWTRCDTSNFFAIDHWKKDYKFGFGMTVGE